MIGDYGKRTLGKHEGLSYEYFIARGRWSTCDPGSIVGTHSGGKRTCAKCTIAAYFNGFRHVAITFLYRTCRSRFRIRALLEGVACISLAALFTGCASIEESSGSQWTISSEQAAALLRDKGAKLVDTRSANERSGRPIAGAIPIQFGANHWSTKVAESEDDRFLVKIVLAGMSPEDRIITICNIGTRANFAAQFLRSKGFRSVYSVSGGYIGNERDVGWQFLQ